jgi:hypothetical protein
MPLYEIKNRVKVEFRNDPRYVRAFDSLTKMLETEEELDTYAIHEAGHLTYFLRMGIPEPEITYDGPTILYSSETQEFIFYPCAVRIPKKYLDAANLESLAKAAAAGGVYESELEKGHNLGDKSDRHSLHRAYAIRLTRGVIPAKSENDMWEWAQNEVRLELALESNRADAFKKAEVIKEKCFRISN